MKRICMGVLLCLSGSIWSNQNLQNTVNALQAQIRAVDASIGPKIASQAAATDRSIQALQADLKKQVAALNQKMATVQAEAKTMVDVASKQSRQDTLKVRTELMAGLKALQKVVTDSHNQMAQQLAKLNAPK